MVGQEKRFTCPIIKVLTLIDFILLFKNGGAFQYPILLLGILGLPFSFSCRS
jgi:hypothetical protein